MHTDAGVSLGFAVGRMAYDNFNENGIRGMFDRLQTANSWKELTRHARGLIRLLRRERILLDRMFCRISSWSICAIRRR